MLTPEHIAYRLLQIKAIKLSPQKPFTWASGLRSPIYCDNRLILSYPEFRSQVVDAFIHESRPFVPFDVIAGVATGGIAYGALIADRMELPMIYVRSEAKGHGLGNQIEGRLEAGQRVLVIEDLLSTGGSSLKAIRSLQEAGAVVTGLLAVFSYGFEACNRSFAEARIRSQTLTDYPTLLRVASSNEVISRDEFDLLQSWNKDPKAWSEKHSD